MNARHMIDLDEVGEMPMNQVLWEVEQAWLDKEGLWPDTDYLYED